LGVEPDYKIGLTRLGRVGHFKFQLLSFSDAIS